jgi:hypothetical protein
MKSALHITGGYTILRGDDNQEAREAEGPGYYSEILATERSFRLDKEIELPGPQLVTTKHSVHCGAVILKVGSIHLPFTLTVMEPESIPKTLV